MHNHNPKNRIGEHMSESGVAMTDQCCQAVDEVVQQNPIAVTLVVFGVGVALGTALVALLGTSQRPTHRTAAESLGRKVLDSLTEYLPASVRHHLPV